jgi:hypothetical protein
MVEERHSPGMISRNPEFRSWSASADSAHSALIQSLQSLRKRVLERLDSLETLARQQSASAPEAGACAGVKRNLELKLAELEETQRRLDAEAERQEKEWSASLSQLEADRRLLAEAWERVERERIADSGASEPHHHSQAQDQGTQKGASATFPHAGALVTTRSAAADSDPNQPVAQAIRRQFQTLWSDVRRNAEERRDSRSAGRRPES